MTNQKWTGQSDVQNYTNWSNIPALEELNDLIEDAKIELQRTVSLVSLGIGVQEAFAISIANTSRIVELVTTLKGDELAVGLEKLYFYSQEFDSAIKQIKQNMRLSEVNQ